ncbi:hypothetical protein EVAR_98056_1 [Eumeta japonica]|uniref:Uncharacterized protein n=1 Tax=Eumeta variegata TaxID=151549 RepID=A0A4C1WEI1_EUMVA|nr:hypothetical protein EVAR_98056_1 [Eumeta japonica]
MKNRLKKNPERIRLRARHHLLNSNLSSSTIESYSHLGDSHNKTVVFYNRNQEEYTTLAQTIVEIRKAADELFQLSEMDVKACTKQRKRRTKEKQKEHTFPTVFIDTL